MDSTSVALTVHISFTLSPDLRRASHDLVGLVAGSAPSDSELGATGLVGNGLTGGTGLTGGVAGFAGGSGRAGGATYTAVPLLLRLYLGPGVGSAGTSSSDFSDSLGSRTGSVISPRSRCYWKYLSLIQLVWPRNRSGYPHDLFGSPEFLLPVSTD